MSSRFRIARIVVLVALAGLAAQPLLAQTTLISNLDGNDASQSAGLNDLRNKGMGFTMPAGQDYQLQYVTLRLNIPALGIVPIVELWSNLGGLPGASIETLTNPAFPTTGIANYDFTSSGSVLVGGESYWLVVYGVAGVPSYDFKASSPAQPPTGIATHLGALFDTNGPPPTTTSSIICSYSVTGTLVPVELMSFTIE